MGQKRPKGDVRVESGPPQTADNFQRHNRDGRWSNRQFDWQLFE
jgi:hypothetical protein